MRTLMAIVSSFLCFALWWSKGTEDDIFEVNKNVVEISSLLGKHARQIRELDSRTLTFDGQKSLKRFVAGEKNFFGGIKSFFMSFDEPQNISEEVRVLRKRLEQKIVVLEEKVDNWERETELLAEATLKELEKMAEETNETAKKISGLKIEEGFMAGARARSLAFYASLLLVAMLWFRVVVRDRISPPPPPPPPPPPLTP